jgi:hypothetical protein
MKKQTQETQIPKAFIQSTAATAFTDNIKVAVRMDGIVFLQFVSETPDITVENFRTMMTKDSIKAFIDVLVKATDHYPVKPKTLKDATAELKNKKTK